MRKKKDENKIGGETIEEEELENESQTKKEAEIEVNDQKNQNQKYFIIEKLNILNVFQI